MEIFNIYLKALKKFSLSEITEHTHRKELQELLETIAKDSNKKIKIQHEPKRTVKLGAPDFKITLNESIIGYVENKKIEENLDETLKSDQIKKYKELSDNILLTNYIEWVWIHKNENKKEYEIKRATLCYKTDLENRKFTLDKRNCEKVYEIIKFFLSQAPKGIGKAKDLANALAIRGRLLRDFLREELLRQEKEHQEGKLFGLFKTFRENIHAELTLDSFADAYSQTLIYGLFLAELKIERREPITLNNAKKFIPAAFELIKELVDFIDELDKDEYKEVRWIVEEVLSIMNNLELESLHESLSYKNWHRALSKDMKDIVLKDPYVYFYEDFLAAYDPKLRKAKGVYYTPPPVVNFIIRAIDDILVDTFGIKDGFAERHKVTVLDFAAGTGTFLLEIFENIFEKLPQKSGKRELIIKEHLLKNIYGFEYLIAPYTIAHLKLSQFLEDNGHKLEKNERLQVFLTNTLEPLIPQYNAFVPALFEEGKCAKEVKEKPILVITGNPPYSGHSQNPSWIEKFEFKDGKAVTKRIQTWIGKLIESYKLVDGKTLGEKNPKWLQDDYVKFIRFAQYKMDQVEEGIVGIITNHSFLDNPTFRGMRQSLMNSFNQLYFLDLHGNAKKKEKTPDGGKDENVFDIEQGVSISILIKKNNLEKKIFHSDFYGLREEKYFRCLNENIKDVEWKSIKPETPQYLLKYQNTKSKINYENGFYIKEIFKIFGNGIVTKRDSLVIDFNTSSLLKKLEIFKNKQKTDGEISELYKLPIKDKDKWDLNKSRLYIQSEGINESKCVEIQYRIFDKRILYHDEILVARLVKDVTSNFVNNKINIGLIIGRAGQNVDQSTPWNLSFISSVMSDLNLFYRGGATVFPLYIYNKIDKPNLFELSTDKKDELNFTKKFREYFEEIFNCSLNPNEIMSYIYSILYCPTYRFKYKQFLDIDFPRIPFPDDKATFEKLSSLGWELIQIHLMNKEYMDSRFRGNDKLGAFSGEGNNDVIKVEYTKDIKTKTPRIKINKEQYFDNVPEEIYNFYIGGYQVLYKYLNDRKGRTLTLDEIENVENIVKVIDFTIKQMEKIDKLTKEWI
jgi:predicted helicase